MLAIAAAATDPPGGPVDVNIKAQYGVTPLMLASYAGHWRTVHELLRLGARPDVVDRHRASPLVYAVLTPTAVEPCPAIVRALIRHNANVDELVNVKALCATMDIPTTVIRCASLEVTCLVI
jgi:ankyrin repeat protein